MMRLFSNEDVRLGGEVLRWAETFLAEPNELMRRTTNGPPEPVCPFVRPALQNRSVYLAIHREVNGRSAQTIADVMTSYVDPFKVAAPYDEKGKAKKALIVVFPEIPEDQTAVLDVAFELLKPAFIKEGLMVTQCHASCEMRSVHTTALRAYASPQPLMAMRHMAIHDILFVGEDPDWFHAYNLRFGHRYKDPSAVDEFQQPLSREYARARTRFLTP